MSKLHLLASGTMAICLLTVVVAMGTAEAASPCAKGLSASADGSKVFGSECGDRIVVRSPRVREVFGGNGNDEIFANPNVRVVEGGEGDDVIYGELLEAETAEGIGPETPEPGIVVYSRKGDQAHGSVAQMSLNLVECAPKTSEGKSCYGGDGSQELIGGANNDKIFGQRGNDVLKGQSGNDELFGGVGDECTWVAGTCAEPGLIGGSGSDLLAGGLGLDWLNGNQDGDLLRADGTTDVIQDTGNDGSDDTISFATAVSPGFTGGTPPSGFPADEPGKERGVYIRLDGLGCEGEYEACNNDARYGGGFDNLVFNEAGGVKTRQFENVIGSPFADVIVGSTEADEIYGGGGADAIYGKGGADAIYGGADGDFIDGEEGIDSPDGEAGEDNCATEAGETAISCAGSASAVQQRNQSLISVGISGLRKATDMRWSEVFLVGSQAADYVKATYGVSGTPYVVFETEAGSAGFDTSTGSAGCAYTATVVKCTIPTEKLDAVTMGGMAGDDRFTLAGFPETTSPVLLGGEGGDTLSTSGQGTEDLLVDGNGAGNDSLVAGSYDDGLINNEGADTLQGGNGNDLLLSASICDSSTVGGVVYADTLQGAASGAADGEAVNSASWAKLPEAKWGVAADIETTAGTPAKGKAGNGWAGARNPSCGGGSTVSLLNIDDLEGSQGADQLYGDKLDNNLLGRPGKDELWARAGEDNIEAKDAIAEIGGAGEGADFCTLDPFDSFSSC